MSIMYEPFEEYRPHHLYSMKQAIREGFILDVLENYITYRGEQKVYLPKHLDEEFPLYGIPIHDVYDNASMNLDEHSVPQSGQVIPSLDLPKVAPHEHVGTNHNSESLIL